MPSTRAHIYTFTTHNFVVNVDAFEDNDLDLSWDETGEVERDILSGKLTAFCIRATVTDKAARVLACDYLGGCIYKNTQDFRTSGGTYKQGDFADMVRNVCREARETLAAHASIYVRS